VNHEDRKQLLLVHYIDYCFNISKGNQCLQHRILISTPLSLASCI